MYDDAKRVRRIYQMPRTVSGSVYHENKDMFDEAERQGKIRVKKDSSQITDGNKKYPPFETYHIEPVH